MTKEIDHEALEKDVREALTYDGDELEVFGDDCRIIDLMKAYLELKCKICNCCLYTYPEKKDSDPDLEMKLMALSYDG